MPNLDWTGIDRPHNMKSDALTLPLVPPRNLQLPQTETLYVTTCHPQFRLHRNCRSGFVRRWFLKLQLRRRSILGCLFPTYTPMAE